MRMTTDEDVDEELAAQTIAAAIEAGMTVFDTARAYGRGERDLGGNERLLAGVLRRCGAEQRARIVTKGGMTRAAGGWVPDGRAKAIVGDCEASLVALDGLAIDLYLIHAPDPRTPWRTSVRALARLLDDGLVRRVGLSNVNRRQLDEAIELAPVAAVEVGLSVYDDRAVRGGVVERCAEVGIAVIAHSPLGGPRRAGSLARRQPLADVAQACSATAAEVALAWLLGLSPAVVAIPGARRPETARSAARSATLVLGADDHAAVARTFGSGPARARTARASNDDAEVVLVMGIPGAGKSRVAKEYVGRGYVRLNRDERGGALRELAGALDQQLSSGFRQVVLDNTYLTRAARSYVLETASRHSVPTRCVWLDTPLAQAQVNLVERLLEQFGALPTPEQLRALARREAGALLPTSQMRTLRELEPPESDEGFSRVEVIPFARTPPSGRARVGVFVAAPVLQQSRWERALEAGDRDAPHLIYDWRPDGAPDELDPWVTRVVAAVAGPVEGAICPHAAGPPSCWCRPPLPGLALAFARAHDVDPGRSLLIGSRPAHRTLAVTLGARYIGV
jgi:aryl-alcohol dehydrogenase-like predicted oxidoreductase/predicted kinase